MIYDFKILITRKGIPIGRAFVESCNIRFDSEAEITRGIQLVMSADQMDMSKVYTQVEDLIYFDGSRKFNGTWTFSGSTYTLSETFEFNLFTDRIRPIIIVGDTEYSFGDFMVIAAPKKISKLGSYYQIEGYDETMKLKQSALEERIFFGIGTKYLTAINQLLTSCGFTNILSDPSSATLQTDREFEQGETYISIINTLLSEINFNNVHMEADNYIYLTQKAKPTEPEFIYSDKHDFNIVGTITVDTDIYDLPNVLVGVASNPDQDEPYVYKKINNDPLSLISVFNRGYKVVKVYNLSNIPSQQELINYIELKYLEATQTTEKVDITTELEPNHKYSSAIQIDTDELQGLFIEKAWQIKLGATTTMMHSLERKVYV
ncbi:MAG: hypothetical protein J6N95_05665 [Bacilli bacterium]|nr:hypothetical protein [Bacilli bacterium]